MVFTLTPEHLAFGNGLILDGFDQAMVIVPGGWLAPDRHGQAGHFRELPSAISA
jgi:hypothetical protein